MSTLKFYARADLLEPVPNFTPSVGGFPRYVGRVPVIVNGRCTWPATQEAFEVDSDSEDGRALIRVCSRDASVWPADQETASACGIEFKALDFADGEWVVRSSNQPAVKAAASKTEK